MSMENDENAGPALNSRGVLIERRTVPFPASISPQALKYLQSTVGADGAPLMLSQATPAADDFAGWTALRAQNSSMLAQILSPTIAGLNAVSETIDVDGVVVHVATPLQPDSGERAYVDIHGGALLFGDGEPCRMAAVFQAARYNMRCYAIDYRMPPEFPYPAALDDCLIVYRALLKDYAAENIIVGGGSAGGNLAAAMTLRARDEGLPLPAALVLITPELDLTESGDSFQTNQIIDVVLPRPLMPMNLLYAAGHPLDHPYLSPLFGDFTKGFPPTFLQSGTRDLFLSNVVRMHRALRRAGVPVELHIGEGMPHGGFMGAPEDLELSAESCRFVAERWRQSE